MQLDAGEDVSGRDQELFNSAREQSVFLWMISPSKWRERSTPQSAETVAGCYDALAEAAELMGLADSAGRDQEPAMKLLAEAQSAVRAAIEDFSSTGRDEDQDVTFAWLRRETDSRSVYVEFMQLHHPAPPDNHADLRRRIAGLRGQLESLRGRELLIEKAIGKVRWHATRIARDTDAGVIDAANPDLATIASQLDWLVSEGVPPSDTRIRGAMLPVMATLADADDSIADAAPALGRVLRAVQDFLDQEAANREAIGEPSSEGTGSLDPADGDRLIALARERCSGKDAVLIGGVPSEVHRARLERGLGLRSLNWIRVEHHESFQTAGNAIRRDGVGIVLIMTRWRSHRDGPEARTLCRSLSIPLVELPAGYNLRQVAHRIVEQVPQ